MNTNKRMSHSKQKLFAMDFDTARIADKLQLSSASVKKMLTLLQFFDTSFIIFLFSARRRRPGTFRTEMPVTLSIPGISQPHVARRARRIHSKFARWRRSHGIYCCICRRHYYWCRQGKGLALFFPQCSDGPASFYFSLLFFLRHCSY